MSLGKQKGGWQKKNEAIDKKISQQNVTRKTGEITSYFAVNNNAKDDLPQTGTLQAECKLKFGNYFVIHVVNL